MSNKTPQAKLESQRRWRRANRARVTAQQREWRKKYQGRCVVCGAPTDGSNGRAKAPKHCKDHNPSQQLAPCGTRSAYTRGCRCDECRAAQRDFMREYYRRRRAAAV